MQYKGIREGIRRPLLGYVSLFFVSFYFCEKRGVLKCKGILREYSASGTAVLGSNSAEMTTVGGGKGCKQFFWSSSNAL